jgi:hypothetical protein
VSGLELFFDVVLLVDVSRWSSRLAVVPFGRVRVDDPTLDLYDVVTVIGFSGLIAGDLAIATDSICRG